jgi:hypothetical protein
MDWTPEIFAAIATGGGGGLLLLKRLGVLNLAWTRNNKPKGNPAPVSHEVRNECLAKHEAFGAAIDQLETECTTSKTMIGQHEKRHDSHDQTFKEVIKKIDDKFETTVNDFQAIKISLAVLADAAQRRRSGDTR